MELTLKNIEEVFDRYFFEFNTLEIRNKLIHELNSIFLVGVAKFVIVDDGEKIDKFIDSNEIPIMISYNDKLYSINEFIKIFKKLERKDKIINIDKNGNI